MPIPRATLRMIALLASVPCLLSAVDADAAGRVPGVVVTATPSLPGAGVLHLAVKGDRSPFVALVQSALMATGIQLVGGADGIFGRYTEAAVRRFQADRGLTADGIVGPATATALGLSASGGGNAGGTGGAGGSAAGPVFPTRPTCTFSDTFGAPRSGGRTHEGVDIMAPTGTPVFAMYAGTVTKLTLASSGTIAGNAVRLTLADGTYLFYAHLDAFAPGIAAGVRVAAGDSLGTVGRTGNASVPHLHLEIHPDGGAAVNPYPLVRSISGCR